MSIQTKCIWEKQKITVNKTEEHLKKSINSEIFSTMHFFLSNTLEIQYLFQWVSVTTTYSIIIYLCSFSAESQSLEWIQKHDSKHALTTSSIKHGGGSFMAWTCLSCNGTGKLAFVADFTAEGGDTKNAEVCVQIQSSAANSISPLSRTECFQGSRKAFHFQYGNKWLNYSIAVCWRRRFAQMRRKGRNQTGNLTTRGRRCQRGNKLPLYLLLKINLKFDVSNTLELKRQKVKQIYTISWNSEKLFTAFLSKCLTVQEKSK